MKPKTFDRVKRYIQRNDTYHLMFMGEEHLYRSSAFNRPATLRERKTFCRGFNLAREQGFNLGKRKATEVKAE